MKWAYFFLLLSLAFAMKSQNLAQYQWKNRIVIVQPLEDSRSDVMQAYTDSVGIKDRKLLFFLAKEGSLYSQNAKEPIVLKQPNFIDKKNRFYLIGLDGGIKAKGLSPLSERELFSLIDQMPMRIREIGGGHE